MSRFILSIGIVLLTSLSVVAQSGGLMGQSVYGTANGQAMSLRNSSFTYQPIPEPKTYKEQDFITVIVNDTAIYSNNNDLQRQRKIKGKMGLTDWVRWPDWSKLPQPLLDEPPVIGAEIDHQSRSKGQLSRTEKLIFKITCRVSSVMDNGNLHIEGQQRQQIGEENKVVYFSGVIRPEDIQPDNTITSDRVYDRDFIEIPSGQNFDAIKRSYGQRFIDRWMPF